jgi:chorismate mutase/prephenate dehydratase
MKIEAIRHNIDEIDKKIVSLLNARAKFAMEIGALKKNQKNEIYISAREKDVLIKAIKANKGPLDNAQLFAIFREIMSASLALEKKIKIAYLGPASTFTHQAAISRFGTSVEYEPCETIKDIFEQVEKKVADYGVVPAENSTEGSVNPTLDELMSTPLKICAEIYLPIAHHLLSKGSLKQIKKILSNPMVFGQCRVWIRKELPAAELCSVSSTARAAELAAKDKHSAAIAGELAAKIFKLKMLAKNIQDNKGNTTRFLVIGKKGGAPSGDDKTSLLFSVKHHAGSLYETLGALKRANLNMTKIESRPNPLKRWEYFFFVDIEGHMADKKVCKALKNLNKHCTMLTILGSYPKAPEGNL